MSACQGCGGVLGRDCFNEQDCVAITRDQQQCGAQAVEDVAQLEGTVEALRQALIPFAFIGRDCMEPLGLADEYDEARRLLGLPPARMSS